MVPARVLSELPIALHTAGTTIRHIQVGRLPVCQKNINLLPPRGVDPSSPAWDDLREAFGTLEVVILQEPHDPHPNDPVPSESWSIINKYVGALVSGPRLKSIILTAEAQHRLINKPARFPLGALLSSITSPDLYFLRASEVSVHQRELEDFFARPSFRSVNMAIMDANLCSGIWEAPMKDVKRRKEEENWSSVVVLQGLKEGAWKRWTLLRFELANAAVQRYVRVTLLFHA